MQQTIGRVRYVQYIARGQRCVRRHAVPRIDDRPWSVAATYRSNTPSGTMYVESGNLDSVRLDRQLCCPVVRCLARADSVGLLHAANERGRSDDIGR